MVFELWLIETPTMQIQLYLSADTQHHFGISPEEILSDSEVPLSSDWRALWRCDHLVSADDAEEHLFILTNIVSSYSIIVVDREHSIDQLIGNFQQALLMAFCDHGMPFPTETFCSEIQLLINDQEQRSAALHYTADLAIESLCANDIDINATEKVINIDASKKLQTKLTPKVADLQSSPILAFPGCAVGQ